jgi:hypothetical protein
MTISSMRFRIDQAVRFAGGDSVVREIGQRAGRIAYRIDNGPERLPMWVPEDILVAHQHPEQPATNFHHHTPHMIVVDDFFRDPDEVRALALAQEYDTDLRYFKGLRTYERFLWPHLREEFGRLLGRPVTEWLGYPANGIFQQTSHEDPLVWHHDDQQYAAAVYLTPDAPLTAGTSFWRDRTCGCRRGPVHPLEEERLGSPEAVEAARAVVYDEYTVEHPDNWELVDSVAGIYNRLVLWDAKLIHSATSYTEFGTDGLATQRLVQLFFFDAA